MSTGSSYPRKRSFLPAIIRPRAEAQFFPAPRSEFPRLAFHRVMILNDDYTDAEFVTRVLRRHFGQSRLDAEESMFQIHFRGAVAAGVYPVQIAEQKRNVVMRAAQAHGYPLMVRLEAV